MGVPKNFQEAQVEKDMLEGYLVRMFVTDDMDELDKVSLYAMKSIADLHSYHGNKLRMAKLEPKD